MADPIANFTREYQGSIGGIDLGSPGAEQTRLDRIQRQADRHGRSLVARLFLPLPAVEPWGLWSGAIGGSARWLWSEPQRTVEAAGFGEPIRLGPGDPFEASCSQIIEHEVPPRLPLLLAALPFDADRRGGLGPAFDAERYEVSPLIAWRGPGSAGVGLSIEVSPGAPAALLASALRAQLDRLAELRASVAAAPAEARLAVWPQQDGERDAWCARVEAARAAIRGGQVDKLVLATQRRREASPRWRFDPGATALRMRSREPDAFVFALRLDAERWWVGASPELLLALDGDRLSTIALAGTAPRSADDDQDRALGRRLLESEKDDLEQAIVARTVAEALGPVADRIEMGPRRLMRFASVQHLATEIRGRARQRRDLVSLARLIQPTPAVSGAPRAAALAWLRAHEPLHRGLYGGAIGVLDASGEGRLAVGIRAAVIGPRESVAFAGAGIVGASIPEREWEEVQLKLAAIESALVEVPG